MAPNSYQANPAALGVVDSNLAALMYLPSRFGLRELGVSSAIVALTLSKQSCVAVDIYSAGGEIYRELHSSFSVAQQLTESFKAGLSIHFTRMSARDFAPLSLLSFDAGTVWNATSTFSVAASVSNISRAQFGAAPETAVQQMRFGAGAKLSDDFFLDADYVVTLNRTTRIQIAARYDLLEVLKARLAFASDPRSAEFDVSLHATAALSVLSILHYHDVLGFTPAFGLCYEW